MVVLGSRTVRDRTRREFEQFAPLLIEYYRLEGAPTPPPG